MKNRKMTPERVKFIQDNYETSSLEAMASGLGISFSTVLRWCDDLGLKTDERKKHPTTAKVEQAKKITLPVQKQEGRPPAVYSNVSREQHIDKWLKATV